MGNLTKNFSRKEFACKCGCSFDTIDFELINVCQDVADNFRDVVYVNSGCRCESHNEIVGGSENSQHLYGRAADLRLKHTGPDKVHAYLTKKYPDQYGIGKYNTFTHIDTRNLRARW